MTAAADSGLPRVPGGSLWSAVFKLLRLRVTIWVGGFRRARLRQKIGIAALGLLGLAFLAFIFTMSWLLLRFLRSPQLAEFVGNTAPFLDSIPVMILSGTFFAILMTSFGVLLQALYLAGDMDFLLATPVPIRAVFISKLLQAILPNFSLILLFALPILYGLGAARGYNLLYYPLVLLMLAALALAAAGLSSLLVMAVVRVFPARRVAEVLGLVVGVSSFLCSQSGQLANMNDVSSQQATAALDALQQINSPWSPLAWAGRGLVALGEGRWLPGGGLALLSLGLAAGAFYLSLVTAERLYYTGWASLQSTSRRKKTPVRTAERPAALLWSERLVPPAVRAVIVKDFLVLRRDLRNLSQIITPLILGVIYAFALLRRGGEPPAGRGEAPAWFMAIAKNLMLYGNIGISLFVSWTLLSRLAGMGFSQEGKSYWLIRIAPVSPRKLAAAKFLVAYLPALALGWGFMLAISLLQGAGLGTLVYGLAAVALTIAGTTGIYLAFGITGANMEWEDPRKMVSGGSGCLGALVTLVYLVLALLLFFGPAVGVELLGWPAWIGQAIGLALGAAASLFCAIVPTSLVLKQIPRLGESAISK